jgi:hypothetical protein
LLLFRLIVKIFYSESKLQNYCRTVVVNLDFLGRHFWLESVHRSVWQNSPLRFIQIEKMTVFLSARQLFTNNQNYGLCSRVGRCWNYSGCTVLYIIQGISLFLTFRFCRDWEFRAVKIQA